MIAGDGQHALEGAAGGDEVVRVDLDLVLAVLQGALDRLKQLA